MYLLQGESWALKAEQVGKGQCTVDISKNGLLSCVFLQDLAEGRKENCKQDHNYRDLFIEFKRKEIQL